MRPTPVPRATYRLQLHAGFGFAEAEAVVPYLADLGVSHLYLSPFLKARPGSTHGYDIVDFAKFNPEIGDDAGLERLAAACRGRGMGIVMDFVPNHMGIGGADNEWWLDVLEWGEDSLYADYFDIDWQPPRRELRGKVLLPFLGEHYGQALEKGDLKPRFDAADGSISVWYWQHRLPVAVRDYAGLLEPAVAALGPSPDGDALSDVAIDLRAAIDRSGRSALARRRQGAELKERLAAVAATRPPVRAAIDSALAGLAGDVAALHRLLERQAYRISYWRVAADEINYRRFFDRSRGCDFNQLKSL